MEPGRAGIGARVTAALGAHGPRRRLDDGEVLVEQGAAADVAFVVESGTLEAVARTSHGDVTIATMGPDDLIGDVTVIAGGTRTATVRATGPTVVRVIERAELERWLDEAPEVAAEMSESVRHRLDRSQVAAFIANLTGSGDSPLAAAMLERVEWRRLTAGEVLFERGDPSDAAYFVLSGRLVAQEPSADGSTTVVAEVGRGEVVGELGLVDDEPRSARVQAVRDTTLAVLPTATFEALVDEHPTLMLHVTRAIVRRVRSRQRPVDRAASLTVVVTAPVDPAGLVDALVAEISRHGSVRHLSSDEVDRLLDRPGIAQATMADAWAPRLTELLYFVDVEHDHVVLQADRSLGGWTRRALAHADRVLIIASPRPDDRERSLIDGVLAEVPTSRVARTLALLHPRSVARPVGTAAVADSVGIDHVVHVREGDAGDLARLARLSTGRGVGLVLGGGGARGFAHLGAYRALREAGVPIDALAACSIGAPLAGGIAQGVPIDSLDDVAEAQFHRLLDYTVPVVALLKGERISANIGERFGSWDLRDLWLSYACVSTNLTSARLEVHRSGDAAKAIRASVAIPGVLPPVPHDGDLLVDGAVLDNLPIGVLRDDASIGTIIAVDVAPPTGPRARSDFGTSLSGTRALFAVVTGRGGPFPRATSVLMRSMFTGSAERQRELVAAGAVDLLLSLHLPGIGLLDFEQVREVSAAGYEAALPEVRRWAADQPWMGAPA